MSTSLNELFESLDRDEGEVALEDLISRLDRLEVCLGDLGEHVQFGGERYRRSLVHRGRGYEVLVLCWKGDQRSPIHDHKGSICAVRVLSGTMTEVSYELDDRGYPRETSRLDYPTGSVCGSQDLDIHEVANLAREGEELVTLHVYAPPLASMGVYDPARPGRRELPPIGR